MMMFVRIVVIPLMIMLYLGISIPLSAVKLADWAFAVLGAACGFDTTSWPLPRGADEDFRFKRKTLWIVGQEKASAEAWDWEFQGVFESDALAVAACQGPNWFVGPAILNEEIGSETLVWPGIVYPHGRMTND